MRTSSALLVLLLLGSRPQDPSGSPGVVLKAMQAELDRAVAKLKTAGDAPLYFLAYRVFETDTVSVSASYGALRDLPRARRERDLDIELRVGSPKLDNTHPIRTEGFNFDFDMAGNFLSSMPIDDDEAAVRAALWLDTEKEFKAAQKKFKQVQGNKSVKVDEEDTSDDFSVEEPKVHAGPPADFKVDRAAWEKRLRRLSAIYRDFPFIHESSFDFSAVLTRRYFVTSEGTRIQDDRVQYRLFTVVRALAEDGMELWLYDGYESTTPAGLPDDAALEATAKRLAKDLDDLRKAPLAEPYAGPAILRSRAAGVFFHEIFGHRIEGHRQKDEDEGRTFAKKVGQPVMPAFITVLDDPTRAKHAGKELNGAYKFDDEGVESQRVVLVDKGVLKTFLMGRSPVRNVPKSNGHGRCSPGNRPVARQGNLIVDSSQRVPYAKLREMLLEEVKKQGKPYGLIFDDIAGGFTMTQSFMPQSFKLLPLRVWKVHADGTADQLLRGVDLVGTPLASLERILSAGDDDDVFNGTCGAESGWVPVSAASPSLLVATIEVERQRKGQDKPPLLPAPKHDPEGKPEQKGKEQP